MSRNRLSWNSGGHPVYSVYSVYPDPLNPFIETEEPHRRSDFPPRKSFSRPWAGKVFIGRDRNMRDRLVAIKKVIIFEDAKKKAFLQEAQIMKDRRNHHHPEFFWPLLSGPNVVPMWSQCARSSAGFGPSQYLQALGDLWTGPFLGASVWLCVKLPPVSQYLFLVDNKINALLAGMMIQMIMMYIYIYNVIVLYIIW